MATGHPEVMLEYTAGVGMECSGTCTSLLYDACELYELDEEEGEEDTECCSAAAAARTWCAADKTPDEKIQKIKH